MKLDKRNLLLYVISDCSYGRRTTILQAEEALRGGATMVQLREKNLPQEEYVQEAVEWKILCSRYHVPLIVNDSLEVALLSGADGVHVGLSDQPVQEIRKKAGKDFIIGATAKTVQQAISAQEAGADYIGVGAVFPSSTKPGAVRVTTDEMKRICASVSIPAVAIGGISRFNINQLQNCGIAGISAVSAVFSAENIEKETALLKDALIRLFHKENPQEDNL